MTSFFTFKDYLENRVSSGVVIPKNEKLLKEDLDQFVKGNTTRSQVQNLKRQLTKFVGPKPLLKILVNVIFFQRSGLVKLVTT